MRRNKMMSRLKLFVIGTFTLLFLGLGINANALEIVENTLNLTEEISYVQEDISTETIKKLGEHFNNTDKMIEIWNHENPEDPISEISYHGSLNDDDSLFAPFAIIGSDNRTKVANIFTIPYRQTVYIESYFRRPATSDLAVYRGSGAVLPDGKILTCAHMFIDVDGFHQQAVGANIFWGMRTVQGTPTIDGFASVTNIGLPSEYSTTNQNPLFDFAVARTDSNIASITGGLSLGTATGTTAIRVGSYPGDKGFDQYKMTGTANIVNGVFRYTLDTNHGQSGAPILNTNNQIIGVHSFGSFESGVAVYNGGPAFTQVHLNFIQSII